MTIKIALREINNAVLDLQAAEYNTFERPIQRLATSLNDTNLKHITDNLRAKADLDKFLEDANQGGSMVGSASLNWPNDREKELSIVLQIIERSAKKPEWFLQVAHHYYYSGRKITGDIRKIVSAVFIPFNRDFATYVDEHESELTGAGPGEHMSNIADEEDLLLALYETFLVNGKRPSVIDVGGKNFPEWTHEYLLATAKALVKNEYIMNCRGGGLNVDITSKGQKWARDKLASKATSGVTYNIGSMNQSPLQHNAPGAHGNQSTSYSVSELKDIVEIYRNHVDELGLEESMRRRADAQVATIEAQLLDDPNPTIIKTAGRSLKKIIEGALGSAAGSAVVSSHVWAPLFTLFT